MENSQQKRSDSFWKVFAVILMIVVIGLAGVIAWQGQLRFLGGGWNPGNGAKPIPAALSPSLNSNNGSIYWVTDLAEKSLPFVVNVKTEFANEDQGKDSKGAGTDQKMHKDLMEQWQQMLPGPLGEQFKQFQMPEDHPPIGGEGSGFIIRDNGYIVTNAHVVADANKFTVRLYDGRDLPAKLVGTDQFKDIAVLKIDAGNLPVAPLGDSDAVRIGEPVIAIGSPLGYQQTVTAGIISTNHRSPQDLGQAEDVRTPQSYLQTDAAINRGNSGGPLLNSRGEVIGVNQAIARWDTNGFQAIPIEGIGFALPINSVKASIDEIVKHGKVAYPGIQAKIATLEDYLKENQELKLDVKKGVYVESVTVGGPADRAGIEAGDVILDVDGQAVTTGKQLIEDFQQHKVGERITLRVARQGTQKQENITVVLGELDISGMQQGNQR
jgi:serine protease Do